MKHAAHFTKAEMQCPHCGLCLMQDRFMEALESLRKVWGKPIVVNSGYRCQTHNQRVGGAKTSQHLLGNAADLDTHLLTQEDYATFLTLCRGVFRGIGIGPNRTFIHVDLRPITVQVEWIY